MKLNDRVKLTQKVDAECEDEFHNEDDDEDDEELCPGCGGDRDNPQMVEAEDVEGGDIDTWRDEARQAVQDALDNVSL